MLRFVRADRISTVESAERVLSKYKNSPVEMRIGPSSFRASLIDARAQDGTLYIKFTWKNEKTRSDINSMSHVYRLIRSSVGKSIRFQVNTDSFFGIVGSSTEFPKGSTVDDYINSPFVISFAFNESDQDPIVAGTKGSALLAKVPKNIHEQLPIGPNLEYDPHITVAYFPSLKLKDIELVLRCAGRAAKKTGTISVFFDGSTTFPTPNDEGEYPHVATVTSPDLVDFHNEFVNLVDRFSPGLVDTTFAHKNYNPHVTLRYVSSPNEFTPVKHMAWTIDHLDLSYKGGTEFFPVPLSTMKKASDSNIPFLQVGEARIPIVLGRQESGKIHVHVKNPMQSEKVKLLEGTRVKLVTSKSEVKMEVNEVIDDGPYGFKITYRPLISYLTKESSNKLRLIAGLASHRGHESISLRIASLLEFDEDDSEEEDEDVDALGPGSPGTDPSIVTYVKGPQTQQEIEEPKFTRKMPLHERI